MIKSKNALVIFLIVSLVTVIFTTRSMANPMITEHRPETIMTPEMSVPGTGSSLWIWALVGGAIAAVAAVLSQPPEGGGNDGEPPQPTGSYEATW